MPHNTSHKTNHSRLRHEKTSDPVVISSETAMTSAQRPVDESANLITHGLGFLLSLVATVYLMRLVVPGHQLQTIVACGVYCSTLVLLYAASTLSHTFHDLELRRLFRTLDQACIFLLIAGSITPYAVIFLNHGWWWLLLWTMWGLALTGVVFVLRRRDLSGPAKFSYGVMGWLPIVALWELYHRAPLDMLLWLVAGGAFYSIGAIFLTLDRRVRYFHAVWHLLVIAGSICHYVGIIAYVAAT